VAYLWGTVLDFVRRAAQEQWPTQQPTDQGIANAQDLDRRMGELSVFGTGGSSADGGEESGPLDRFDGFANRPARSPLTRRALAVQRGQQENRQNPPEQAPTIDTLAPNLDRHRPPVSEILTSSTWRSQGVQNLLTEIHQLDPKSQEWSHQASEIVIEYKAQMENANRPKAYIESCLDTIADMFKPGGYVYEERRKEITRSEILTSSAWQIQDVQNLLTEIHQLAPESREWSHKASEVIVEYQMQIGDTDRSKTDIEAHLNIMADMFKPGGSIYEERRKEIARMAAEKRPVRSQADLDLHLHLPPRERGGMEALLATPAWQSQEVQDSFDKLKQERPGTQKWNEQAADLLYEYEDKMQKLGEAEPIEKMDILSDALKVGGSIYMEVERERR